MTTKRDQEAVSDLIGSAGNSLDEAVELLLRSNRTGQGFSEAEWVRLVGEVRKAAEHARSAEEDLEANIEMWGIEVPDLFLTDEPATETHESGILRRFAEGSLEEAGRLLGDYDKTGGAETLRKAAHSLSSAAGFIEAAVLLEQPYSKRKAEGDAS